MHQLLPALSKLVCLASRFLVHALQHAAPNRVGYSTMLRSGLLSGQNPGGKARCFPDEKLPRLNMRVSCNGATVSMETAHFVLDPYDIFRLQSVGK